MEPTRDEETESAIYAAYQHVEVGIITYTCLKSFAEVYKAGRSDFKAGIRTLHDCPSQMNENLLISNSKLTSDSELIWWR